MERYAVQNVGSGEIISPWYTTEARAHEVAAECEAHETQPDCEVVRFSEWAVGRRVAALRNERWEGAYPLVTFGPGWSLVFTGEIVPAQEPGITVLECGRAAYRRGG